MADDVHIRLDFPKAIRRELLESALHASEFLQVLGKIEQFEQERLVLKTDIANNMTDLTTAAHQFFKSIPPLPLEFIKKQEQVLHRQMIQQQPMKVLTPRQEMANRLSGKITAPQSFLSPLEEEMAELKRRIKNLEV